MVIDVEPVEAGTAKKEIEEDLISVLMADDHILLRDSLAAFFSLAGDIKVIGEASDGQEAVDKTRCLNPDITIMDLAMPIMDGLEATRSIIRNNEKAKVLILTQYDDREHIIASIRAGAYGYVPKWASGADVLSAIRTIHQGDHFLHPFVASTLINDYLQKQSTEDPFDLLTGREQEVLKRIAEGQTSRQISNRFRISVSTVQKHREHIMKKLNLHNHADLIKYAIRKGLVYVGTQ